MNRPATAATIVHVSDTHLSRSAPEHEPAWRRAAAYIRARRPDPVIHTGDIVQDETSDDDHGYALDQLRSLGVDWAAIPGNHDIGDGPPIADLIRPDLVRRFSDTYGASHWSRTVGGWRIIGANTMLFGTGTDHEAAEWRWLRQQLDRTRGASVMLCVHKPPFLIDPEETDESSATMPRAARGRF